MALVEIRQHPGFEGNSIGNPFTSNCSRVNTCLLSSSYVAKPANNKIRDAKKKKTTTKNARGNIQLLPFSSVGKSLFLSEKKINKKYV